MGRAGCEPHDGSIIFYPFEADRTADLIGRELPGGASQYL
ncbi:hypothetical protein PseBG33_2143 [Pseudomonas synxantha BG33R]|nr:hypothetical protein PseBG33_2143 [Pseudomonas synxantha BG33R]